MEARKAAMPERSSPARDVASRVVGILRRYSRGEEGRRGMLERGGAALRGGGEMGALIRAHDWAGTALGPVETWPQSLLSALSIVLSAQTPTYVGWGPDLVQLYNDAYRALLGSTKHPAALGQTCRACFPEIWSAIGPMLDRVMTTGEPTFREDELLCLD